MQHDTFGRFVFATLLVALGTTSPAAAIIDGSGDYVTVSSSLGIFCKTTNVQTGTSLRITGVCTVGGTEYPLSLTGTVDPDTGEFRTTGELTGLCPDLVVSGASDGEEARTTSTSNTCGSGTTVLSKCSNGVIDPLENCEDGNAVEGDCCSARCRLDPAGTACTSDGNDCTDDVCNATGACMHVPTASPCDDGNACTLGDVCAGGACVPGSTPAPAGQACTDDFDPCTADVCDATGTCTHVPVSPAECRARTACHSTCTQQLKACRQTCPGGGQARRACRAACAERSTCTAPGAAIRTLAYVVTNCSTDPQGRSALTQKLLIRHGNCDPITATAVTEVPPSDPIPDPGRSCQTFGRSGWGSSSVAYGALQRLGVSPDGSGVVFEVNDEFSTFPRGPSTSIPPEEQGLFFVRSNGTGRRRLGPASREPSFSNRIAGFSPPIPFSPNGRRIAFTDRGTEPGEEETVQIVVLDLATDPPTRTQVTHLPSGTAPSSGVGDFLLTGCPTFINDETVLFGTFVDPVVEGKQLNPMNYFAAFTVRIDGSQFTALPAPVASQKAHLVPTFGVIGLAGNLVRYALDGPAVNANPLGCGVSGAPPCDYAIQEVFLQHGKDLLQVTQFKRVDTFIGFPNTTRTRAFFMSSADLGENPHQNCQIFSVDTLGSGLRQVTHFNQGGGSPPALRACFYQGPPNCSVGEGWSRVIVQDPVTNAVIFASNCDPFSTNPNGAQLFAMQPDGHVLRQLTDAVGFVTNPDGSIRVELPGPFAYSAPVP
jgi:cysteine-rich repeat protein